MDGRDGRAPDIPRTLEGVAKAASKGAAYPRTAPLLILIHCAGAARDSAPAHARWPGQSGGCWLRAP